MSLKSDILAASAIPEGEAEIAGHKVKIRGLSSKEEIELLSDGLSAGVIPVCACCILDDKGAALFAVADLQKMKGGLLKPVYEAILRLTYPITADEEKNS